MAPTASPPQAGRRSQRAADALLDGPTPAERVAAKKKRRSLGSNGPPPNPYGVPGTNRPLQGARGRNDFGSNGGARGGGSVAVRSGAEARPRRPNDSAASAFDRRNSRDRVSKRAAPPTDTDRNLLALLDGRGEGNKRSQGKLALKRGIASQKRQPPPPPALRTSGSTREKLDKRQKIAGAFQSHVNCSGGDFGALVAPPPPPRYSHGVGGSSGTSANKVPKKPRKRISIQAAYSKKNAWKKKAAGAGNADGKVSNNGRDGCREGARGFGEKEEVARTRSDENAENGCIVKAVGAARERVASESGRAGGISEEDGSSARALGDAAMAASNDARFKTSERRGPLAESRATEVATTASPDGEGGRGTVAREPHQRRGAPSKIGGPSNARGQKMDSVEALGQEGHAASSHSRGGKGAIDAPKSATTESAAAKENHANCATVMGSAASLEDAMPADEELMALPLLGICAKRTTKNKPSLGGRLGSSSSQGAMFSSHGRQKAVAKATFAEDRAGDGSLAETDNDRAGHGKRGMDDAHDELDEHAFDSEGDSDEDATTNDPPTTQHAKWYDPEEHAAIQQEAALRKDRKDKSLRRKPKRPDANINDNFVRQDLRNAAGSCRGARNLKKANKKKLWRAQHRFGMGDRDADDDGEGRNPGYVGADQRHSRYGSKRGNDRRGSAGANGGGDLKCFAAAKNAGVDPLDDFVDGKFSKKAAVCLDSDPGGGEEVHAGGTGGKAGDNKGRAPAQQRRPARDGGVPLCTRHRRPCKLLTVKRNHKGNKGRRFYACPMPRGEQCDFFQWEEDTAAQRALLKSSSSSGFIARQVAASRTRFKELTVPELRAEAKKRGLKSAGKKDQILTRLLIWVRDEVADGVEPKASEENREPSHKSADGAMEGKDGDDPNANFATKDEGNGGEKDEKGDYQSCQSDPEEQCEEPTSDTAVDTTGFIELSNDSESSYEDDGASDDDESSCDELDICHEASNKEPKLNDRSVANDFESDPLHDSLFRFFGHAAFREGQEWAIRRTLSNKNTLLVAPTGQGKSLCYALPAALMEGVCLVVSPLISLMQDQLGQLPPKIPAATLSGSMTTSQMALIVDDVMKGRCKVLFVSPERLASAAFRRLVRPRFNVATGKYERQFPTVSLLCVDEAHCLSQWGHNFRPSYLRVRSLLPLIEPKSVLALTATAGPLVVRDICNTLCIPFDGYSLSGEVNSPPTEVPIEASASGNAMDGDGVKVLNCNRDNIDVFSLVLQSNDERRYLLHKILKEKKNGDPKRSKKLPIEEGCLSKGSVIVYVWRQKDTEIVAEQLNGDSIRGGVVCYHGGMDSGSRSRAQSKFMRGKARICVATVAFGLGINKPDIRGVIHLCLPPSPEHYLQEIGRAGRDGRPAKAIALPLAEEYTSRHSLAHSDRLSRSQLNVIFSGLQTLVAEALGDIPPEANIDLNAERLFIDDMHIAVPARQTVDASDCKEESIETIFSLLEGGGEESSPSSETSLLSVEGYLPDLATITLKRRSLEKLEKVEQIAQSILKCGTRVNHPNNEQTNGQEYSATHNEHYIKYQGNFGGTAMEKGFYAYSFGTYKFSIVRCARCMGPNTEPRHVYAALRRLQGSGELELTLDTTANGRALHLRMNQDGIHLFRTRGGGNSSDQALDEGAVHNGVRVIVTKLSKQFSAKEKVSVGKVESMYEIMLKVSCRQNDEGDDGEVDDDNSDRCEEANKSPRLVLFQKLVQNYFRNGITTEKSSPLPPTRNSPSHGAHDVIKDFPLHNLRLLACLSSDVSLLIQALALRRLEHTPTAVCVNKTQFADYRDLSLAKILHSIDAPRAPISEWFSHVLWGKYRNYSFSSVVCAVKETFEK